MTSSEHKQRILVTGAAGFIGSHLVDQLVGDELILLDDLSTGRCENIAHHLDREDVTFVEGSITDSALVAQRMRGIDTVFHLACRGVRHSIGHPQESHEVNAAGTLNLLRAAHDQGVGRFIHVSTSEVYGTALRVPMDENHPCFPETVYGGAKLAGEAYARAYNRTYGLPTVIVRPFNNFGPRSHFEGDCGEVIPRFIVRVLNDEPPTVFGDGSQTRDFIYVEETAHWLTRIARCDALIGQTINLGSGREVRVLDLARIVCEESGRGEIAPVFLPPRPGDVLRLCADARRAEELLAFSLRCDLREGIRRTVQYIESLGIPPATLLRQVEESNWVMPAEPAAAGGNGQPQSHSGRVPN